MWRSRSCAGGSVLALAPRRTGGPPGAPPPARLVAPAVIVPVPTPVPVNDSAGALVTANGGRPPPPPAAATGRRPPPRPAPLPLPPPLPPPAATPPADSDRGRATDTLPMTTSGTLSSTSRPLLLAAVSARGTGGRDGGGGGGARPGSSGAAQVGQRHAAASASLTDVVGSASVRQVACAMWRHGSATGCSGCNGADRDTDDCAADVLVPLVTATTTAAPQ